MKYFGNEDHEARRYDENLQRYERAAVKSQTSLSALNTGQAVIIAIGVVLIMWRATAGVVAGTLTIGDLVLVNAFLIQLYIPLNFLGVLYREVKQALTNMERMFSLLGERRDVQDRPGAVPLDADRPGVRFEDVRCMSMKSQTMMPPRSRSLICRAISGTASRFVLSAISSKSNESVRVRPELTSIATSASVMPITIYPPDLSWTVGLNIAAR